LTKPLGERKEQWSISNADQWESGRTIASSLQSSGFKLQILPKAPGERKE